MKKTNKDSCIGTELFFATLLTKFISFALAIFFILLDMYDKIYLFLKLFVLNYKFEI